MFWDRFYDLYFQNLRFLFEFKIFPQSKYITGSKKFWGNSVAHSFSKKFLTCSNFRKTTELTQIGKYQPMRLLIKSKKRYLIGRKASVTALKLHSSKTLPVNATIFKLVSQLHKLVHNFLIGKYNDYATSYTKPPNINLQLVSLYSKLSMKNMHNEYSCANNNRKGVCNTSIIETNDFGTSTSSVPTARWQFFVTLLLSEILTCRH